MNSAFVTKVLKTSGIAVLGNVVRIGVALLIATLVAVLLIRVVGGNVAAALGALWIGAFGSAYNVGTTLVAATPLILTGLGVGAAFRCQAWNIGGEGQFLVGCLLASAVAMNCNWTRSLEPILLIPLMLLASAFAGAVWSGLSALMKITRNVPEVISTIMLNFVAFELLSYLVNGPMERPDHSQPATEVIRSAARLPLLVELLPKFFAPSPLHLGFFFALIAVGGVYLYFNMTASGFAMKLVGANPVAATLSGVSVQGTIFTAMLLSGALCGLAGGVELCGNVGCIYEGYQPGYGYQAIAVALLGRLSPIGILLSALFVGALTVGCQNMERSAGIAHETGLIIQATALLVLLATQWQGWSRLTFVRKNVTQEVVVHQ